MIPGTILDNLVSSPIYDYQDLFIIIFFAPQVKFLSAIQFLTKKELKPQIFWIKLFLSSALEKNNLFCNYFLLPEKKIILKVMTPL